MKRIHRSTSVRTGIAHARQIAQDARTRLQERAAAYEATLRSEGYSEPQARSRALQAYGLADAPASPALPDWSATPTLPREWRLAARDHYASQRGPGLGGERTAQQRQYEADVARKRTRLGTWDGPKAGRKAGFVGHKPKRVNSAFVRRTP